MKNIINPSKIYHQMKRGSKGIVRSRQRSAMISTDGSSLQRKRFIHGLFPSLRYTSIQTCRFDTLKFSSESQPPSKMESATSTTTMEGLWRKSTATILDNERTPIGSMDSLQWHLAETLILFWTRETMGNEGVDISFSILERLAEEAYMIDDSRINHDRNDNKMMDIYLVHAILRHWKQCFQNKQSMIRPSEIQMKIDTCLERSSHKLFEPNIATYTIILDGATACPDPKERLTFSEDLLTRLINESDDNPQLRPTIVTFGTIINSFAQSKSIRMAEKAEEWLRRIQTLHEAGWPNVQLNTIVYTSVIKAWANIGEADRAEALLQEMYREYSSNGNKQVLPNLRTYNTVLSAWAKSSSPHCVQSAELFLRKMQEMANSDDDSLDCMPDLVSYNCMLSTIARRRKDRDSLAKAELWMQELLEIAKSENEQEFSNKKPSMMPNYITYTALFKILAASNIRNKAERAKYWQDQSQDPQVKQNSYLSKLIKEMEDNSAT